MVYLIESKFFQLLHALALLVWHRRRDLMLLCWFLHSWSLLLARVFSEAEETVDPAVAAARAAALEEAERVRAEQVCTFSFPSLVNPT